MTTLLCINPKSRSGDTVVDPFIEKLEEAGPVVFEQLTADTDIERIIEHSDREIDRIVIGGGDGTLNRVLKPLFGLQLPVGILPLGTANDFARSLEIPLNPEPAVEVILDGQTRDIDLGVANDHFFLNAAGIGIGPDLNKSLDPDRKKFFGVFAYLQGFIEMMGRGRQRYANITVNGETTKTRFIQITIANGVHYGGGMTIAADADMNDGLLRLLCLQPQSTLELISKIFTLRWGARRGERRDKMLFLTSESIEVTTRRTADVSVDGEIVTETPLECRCLKGAIRFYAPAGR